MPHIGAYLPNLDEKVESRHPLARTQSRLPGEVVEMAHQALHDILEARIISLRVDNNSVLRDIIYVQVLQYWSLCS